MTLKETQDDKDILILMMIQERDKQLEILEEENANLKYDITMGYDEETQLINKIYIKVMRE